MGDHAITLLKDPGLAANQMTPSFDELFSEHHEKVFLAAYRVTGNPQDAEDVVQTVFLRFLTRRDQSYTGDSPAGYLCRSAINGSIDLLRSRQRAPTENLIEERHQAEAGAAESEMEQLELRKALREALLKLESPTAEIFALRYFEDYSNAEIAVILDTTPNNIAVTLHRARAQLQDILGELQGDDR